MQTQTILFAVFSALSVFLAVAGRRGLFAVLQKRPGKRILWYLPAFLALGVVLSTVFSTSSELTLSPFVLVRVLVLTPISEEFIFRGGLLLCPRFLLRKSRYARVFTVLLLFFSAAAFALVHAVGQPMLHAFWMGLCLGAAALSENSLWCSVILHAAWNALCVLLLI